jgi:hypothetical protein
LELIPVGDSTQASIRHYGFRNGADWDQGATYFERAWTMVLEQLTESLAH